MHYIYTAMNLIEKRKSSLKKVIGFKNYNSFSNLESSNSANGNFGFKGNRLFNYNLGVQGKAYYCLGN